MGCCIPNVDQVTLKFDVKLLTLEPQSSPNTFIIKEITKNSFEKEEGMTFVDTCLSSTDERLTSIFTDKKLNEHSIFYCYLRKTPVIKGFKAMKEFKPMNFGQLSKIVILLTNESVKQNISNAIVKKQTKRINEMIDKTVDFTKLKEQMEKALDPNITKDSLKLTDNEGNFDNEEEEDNEPLENELIIEGILNYKVLKEVKEHLFSGKGGSSTKNKIMPSSVRSKEETGISTGIDLKRTKEDYNEVDNDSSDTQNTKINKVVIRNTKFPQIELFGKLLKNLGKFKNLKKFGFINNFIDSDFPGWDSICELLLSNYSIRWLDFHSSTLYDSQLPELTKSLKDKRIRYLDISENFLSYHGMEILAKWLKTNKTLQRLYLQRNAVCQFKAEGVKLITEALKSSQNIQVVDFSFMDLTTCGVHIAELIRASKTLREVCVHCAKLNYGDFKEICKSLCENDVSLKALDIGMNDMGGNKSLEEISNMMKKNKTLTEINLDQIGLTMDNYQLIFDGFEANDQIEKIYFSYNGEVKPKIIINFFMKRKNLNFLEYVAYNPEVQKDKELTLEEKKLIEKFTSSRPEVTLKTT